MNQRQPAVLSGFRAFVTQLSLAQQFMLANLIVLAAGMLGAGWWLSEQTKQVVIGQVAAETALYVDTFIAQYLQGYQPTTALTSEQIAALDRVLIETPLRTRIVQFKIWDAAGRILYSNDHSLIGQSFPMKAELAQAVQGAVAADLSDLSDAENVAERERWTQLLEVYSPLKRSGAGQVVAVIEIYQTVDALNAALRQVQWAAWFALATMTVAIYALLAAIVQRGSNTIARQKSELTRQLAHMRAARAQNEILHERVRRAAAGAAAVNERLLRRIGSEVHDGPLQDLSLALLRLDQAVDGGAAQAAGQAAQDLQAGHQALRAALQELRAIAAGLGLPELDDLSLSETLHRVVRVHQRRTETRVEVALGELPEHASLAVKIALYRVTQEALTNAFRHAAGAGQRVHARAEADGVRLEISDQGPGYAPPAAAPDDHLGVLGMRERVESLGGLFEIRRAPGSGTVVSAYIPIQPVEPEHV